MSVYIHIPFCSTICSYCDFPKIYSSICKKKDYLKSLKTEIQNEYAGEIIETIYIGGGTPSVLNVEELKELLEITNLFQKDIREFTVECNVESITEEKLILMKSYGVNRLSIGVETFQEHLLPILNRNHTKEIAIQRIQLAKKYFKNINIDLMYAIPNQGLNDVKKDLDIFEHLHLKHLSYYSLIIEPHTKLYNEKTEYVDADLDYKMYAYICKRLRSYHHYEISNFSKKGYESIHNLTYWNNSEYYGFGMGASGYVNGVRYENTKNIHDYLSGVTKIEEYKLTQKEKQQEEMFLGLRKLDGISTKKFEEKYQEKVENVFEIKDLLKKGYLKQHKDNLYIPKKYIYISNEILVKFVGD